MIPLSNLSVFEIRGNDARQFLQNQLSADVSAIAVGEAGFACCCNPSGRVLALLLLIPLDDCVMVVLAADLAEEIRSWLGRFILRSDVHISARNDLFVASPGAADVSKAAVGPVEPVEGLSYVLLDEPFPDFGPERSGEPHWKAEELQRGVCWLEESTSAQFLPQMLGFERIGALNFRKGCFPGQEVIARMRYLGKLKRRPLLLQVDSERSLPLMQKFELETADGPVSGVIVDQAETGAGRCLFTVVRAEDEVTPLGMQIEGEALPLL